MIGDKVNKLLIQGGTVLTQSPERAVLDPGYVAIVDDRIVEVGVGEPQEGFGAEETIEARLMAVIPGLVNAHTHLFQTFVRGLADDRSLLKWLETAIWPVMAKVSQEEVYLAALLGLVENIRSGVTSVIDNHYIHTDPGNDDAVCRAAEESGIRFLMARGWADVNYPEQFMESPEHILAETERLLDSWHGAENGRIRIGLGPLIPWGCSDETMRRTYALAEEWETITHMHTAETEEEVSMLLRERGFRHVEWLESLGCLGPRTHLVHSVWVSEEEIALIHKRDAVVVHCPVSNMYLASGIAPVTRLRRSGTAVALATDGPGSNNAQDMMETLKFAACLQKVGTLDAMALLPEDVLWMATMGGARAMGLESEIGSLEVGKKADVTIVDLDAPHMMPVHSAASALVYNANCGDVDTVIVDGRILMQDKRVLFSDEKALLGACRAANHRLFQRSGINVETLGLQSPISPLD